jgi:putative ABC transport system permease protein
MIVPPVGGLFGNALGDGGWVYGPAVLEQQTQQSAQPSGGPNATPPTVFNMFAVRYAAGVSRTAAFASLRRQLGSVALRQLPSEDVLNIQNVDRLPLILAGLVTILGLASIGNSLLTSVRRRRRDLAILKAIGFGPSQVAAVVGWQATAFAAVALIVGIPIGIVAGRCAWSAVASSIGSSSPPQVPALFMALIVPATILFCNLIAAGPGCAAARIAPAVVMRND